MTHAFTLRVSGIDTNGNYEDRLYEAGCNDALIAVVGNGLELDFDRDGASFAEAVASAKSDVERAGGHVDDVVPPPG